MLSQHRTQVEAQIAAIQSAQEQRLNSMPPAARQAYNGLIAEQAALLAEAGRCEEEAAELTGVLAAAEGELSRNGFKQRVLEVQVSILASCCGCPCVLPVCWRKRIACMPCGLFFTLASKDRLHVCRRSKYEC